MTEVEYLEQILYFVKFIAWLICVSICGVLGWKLAKGLVLNPILHWFNKALKSIL